MDNNVPRATVPVSKPGRNLWRVMLVVLAILFGIALSLSIARYLVLKNDLANRAFASASEQAVSAASELDRDFATTINLTSGLANALSDGSLVYDNIEQELRLLLEANPSLDGITVAFDKDAYSPEYEQFIVYVWRDVDGTLMSQVGESRYDYTVPPSDDPDAPQTQWFYVPFNEDPSWREPFLAAGAGRVLIEYGVPFTAPNTPNKRVGVVAVDYSLEGMRSLVAGLDLGLTGFGAVYSDKGTFLSHPVPERVANGNLFTDETLQDEDFQAAARQALEGDTVSVQRVANERNVWNFFAPITSTGWALVVQLSETEFLLGAETLLRSQVAIVLTAGAFLFCMLAVLLHFDRGTRDRLWLASISFSLIGLTMIVMIIVLERRMPKDFGEGVLVTSQAALKRLESTLAEEYSERGLREPAFVPTGILLETVRFPEPSVVTINGYAWQRVPKNGDAEFVAGFSFPQSIDEPYAVEEVYREERESETLVIWTITAALRQVFDPIQYPLDRYDINLRLASDGFASNALLVPDLASYNVTAPSLLPGLDDTVRVNNWDVLASAFSLGFRRYGTNLGIPQRPTVEVPELAFNIRVERRFLGPFVAFFLPALVATIMIFGFLLNDQKPDEPEEIVTALSYTAALFFVVAVLHSALRDNAAAIGLTYLEYFYLLLYVLTLLVAANSFMVARYPYLPLVSIGNNLIAKVLFWPTVVGFMLIVTIYVFIFAR